MNALFHQKSEYDFHAITSLATFKSVLLYYVAECNESAVDYLLENFAFDDRCAYGFVVHANEPNKKESTT